MTTAAEPEQTEALTPTQKGRKLAAEFASMPEFTKHLIPYGRLFSDRHISTVDDQRLSYFVNICYNASATGGFLKHVGLEGFRRLPFAYRRRGMEASDEILKDLSDIPRIMDDLMTHISDTYELKQWRILREKAAVLVASPEFQEYGRDSLTKIDRTPKSYSPGVS